MSPLYTDKVYALAAQIAQDEIDRLRSVSLMQTEPNTTMDFRNLRALIREGRQQELEEMEKADHPAILEDFAADAGYLVGLEMGKRLAGGVR